MIASNNLCAMFKLHMYLKYTLFRSIKNINTGCPKKIEILRRYIDNVNFKSVENKVRSKDYTCEIFLSSIFKRLYFLNFYTVRESYTLYLEKQFSSSDKSNCKNFLHLQPKLTEL